MYLMSWRFGQTSNRFDATLFNGAFVYSCSSNLSPYSEREWQCNSMYTLSRNSCVCALTFNGQCISSCRSNSYTSNNKCICSTGFIASGSSCICSKQFEGKCVDECPAN